MKSLRTLILGSNQIKKLPNSLGTLVNLETLAIDSNKLVEIPRSVSFLSHLKTLHANSNQIVYVDDGIAGVFLYHDLLIEIESLQTVWLANNAIAGNSLCFE